MGCGHHRKGLIGAIILIVHVPAVSAAGQIILDEARVNQLVDKRSATLLSRGKTVATATDSLAALLFNPALLMEADGISSEVNSNAFGSDIIVYQNLWAFGSPWGNFSVGYSLLDTYDNYLRFNQFYDYSLTYSFELIPGIFTGVGFVSDPFRQALSLGISVPLKTNIRIWKNLGIFGIVYGGSVWNITLQKSDSLTLPFFITHGLSFTFLSFRYLRVENFLELSVAQDFVRRSFHEAVNFIFFDFFFLSLGMYGDDVMKLTTATRGAGVDFRRGYTSLKIFYSQENNQGILNQALSASFSLRLSGKPATVVKGETSTQYISPRNSDGLQDVVVYRLRQSREVQAVSWKLVIRNGLGETIRTIDSASIAKEEKNFRLPTELSWNGRDDFNNYVADDIYSCRFIYIATDYQPYFLNFAEVKVDNSPPSVLATAETDTFKTAYEKESEYLVHLSFRNRQEDDLWILRVVSETGADVLVREFAGSDVPDTFRWNLRDHSGKKVSAGQYRIQIDARDAAFNAMPPLSLEVVVAYVELNVTLRQARDAIPASAGSVDFFPFIESPDEVSAWSFRIINGANESIFEKRASLAPKGKIRWLFNESKPQKIPDGFYFAYLTVEYAGERHYESLPARVEIDSVAPDAVINHAPALFSPDGDGIEESVSFTIAHNEKTPMSTWRLEITEVGENKPFRTFSGLGNPPAAFHWDGTSDKGELVKSLQSYNYNLFVSDRAKNSRSISGGPINVDFLIFNLGNELRVQTFGLLFDKVQAKMDKTFYNKLDTVILMAKNRLKDFDLVIEGHSDLYGGNAAKAEISEQRARLVFEYIIGKAPELAPRLSYKGYADSRPVHSELSPEKQRQNRRVEFYFYRRLAPTNGR